MFSVTSLDSLLISVISHPPLVTFYLPVPPAVPVYPLISSLCSLEAILTFRQYLYPLVFIVHPWIQLLTSPFHVSVLLSVNLPKFRLVNFPGLINKGLIYAPCGFHPPVHTLVLFHLQIP
ncbi:hypothetical protein AMECASPLE_017403 [Ameca splendens]|uniref:Uncharacterized protein n=1 Tax=Ameca splendens TaxID=208324 RepID=A0ABV0XRB3_9TELE